MSLTSRDETDLLLPLYQGVHEEPRFATFLERLKRRTGADYVALTVRKEDRPVSEASVFFAGINLHERARELGIEELYTLEGVHNSSLRPYRVYSVSEFVDHDPEYKAERSRNIERLGIVDERVVRVSEESGISAWLVLARSKACSAADSALLSNLAPYVATALTNLNLMERQRIEAALSTKGLGRSGVGWILFDKDARILAIESGAQERLSRLNGSTPRIGERLRDLPREAERTLAEAARRLADAPQAQPGVAVLSEDPRIDALLVSAMGESDSATLVPVPAMIAYCRFGKAGSPERAVRLARLFDLPQREAELAIALSDGHSIAEAADAMGLTIETARNYSKRLYAKLGVRGQAELVRMVYESSAVLG
ncbi:MAG: helix-turn-helix transcriptional regulator [Novosphingobium sp.]|nr:helix-turn-helix transcriptional regulator [Novosphingobium sp.]MCP5402875.1 helix-turn-helix transcriptional regulator [Novosphingobium sp.]